MRRLLALRDARLYLAGQGVSMLGDSSLWLAMGIWVKQLTGSSASAGLTWMAFMAPQLVGPATGLLADRVRRRPLLLLVNLGTAAVVLPLLLVGGRGGVWLIYAVMVAYGASNALIAAAQPGLLRNVVPDDLLADANGVLQLLQQGLRLVSPLVGAGLFATAGPSAVVLLDAATFVAAAAALAAMRVREPAPEPPERHLLAEAAEGVRHVWSVPVLRRVVIAACVASTAFGFAETAMFAVVDAGLHRAPSFLGVLLATQGAAAVAAGGFAAGAVRRLGEPRTIAAGLGLFAAGCPLLMSGSLPVVLAGTLLMGWGIPWTLAAAYTLMQRRTPLGLQGRVYAAVDMLVAGPHVASIAGGAALVATLDYRFVLTAMALMLLAGAALMLTAHEAPAAERAPVAAA